MLNMYGVFRDYTPSSFVMTGQPFLLKPMLQSAYITHSYKFVFYRKCVQTTICKVYPMGDVPCSIIHPQKSRPPYHCCKGRVLSKPKKRFHVLHTRLPCSTKYGKK